MMLILYGVHSCCTYLKVNIFHCVITLDCVVKRTTKLKYRALRIQLLACVEQYEIMTSITHYENGA